MWTGFPTLQPAFTFIVNITTSSNIGAVASGATLAHYPITSGTIVSVPGFTPAINATVVYGSDHLYIDPDGSKIRVNVNCIVKTDDDSNLSLQYHGTYILNDAMKQILSGNGVEGKLPFGQTTTYLTFEVGNGKYKVLEDTTFVGDGRFMVEDGKLAIESRWSAVFASTASD